MNWKPAGLILLVLTALSLACSVAVFADSNYGLDTAANVEGSKIKTTLGGSNSIPLIIGDILTYVLSLVGVVFFVLILYSGLLWMTAGGAPEKLNKAIDILKAAAIGLLIVVGAFALTKFIFQGLTTGTGAGDPCRQAHPTGNCVYMNLCQDPRKFDNTCATNEADANNQKVCCFDPNAQSEIEKKQAPVTP